ncbi:LCP family protein [bacterium]|nr:LCP family protein [bacterium]
MSAPNSNSKRWTATFPWWRWLLLTVFLTVIAALLFAWQFYSSYQTFLTQTGLSSQQLLTMWRQAQVTTPRGHDGQTTILILGTDTLATRTGSLPLTDTIILANLEPAAGQIRLLSIPRDTVLPGMTSRINAIYPSFYQQATASAREKTAEQLSQRLHVPIDYTLLVTMDDVKAFIDLMGGVDVQVQTSFVDYQYPRDDVDVTRVFDPALLYETVEFTAGPAHLDGAAALKFMRSRHAQNSEGSDFARSARQQQVITALTLTLGERLQKQLATYDLTLVGQCYQFYQERFAAQLSFVDSLALVWRFLPAGRPPQITSESLSVNTSSSAIQENKSDYTLRVVQPAAFYQEIKEKLAIKSEQ